MTDPPDQEQDYPDDGRYRTYEADDGSFVVYDERVEDAYVRSDVTVEISR